MLTFGAPKRASWNSARNQPFMVEEIQDRANERAG